MTLTAKVKKKGNAGKYEVASGGFDEVAGGVTQKVKLKLSRRARKALVRKPELKVRTELRIVEVANATRGKARLVSR